VDNFGLYVILSGDPRRYEEIAGLCVRRAVRMLQLREKNLSDRPLLKLAQRLAKITRGSDTAFFVNDRVDIALLSRADGVHLGQEDLEIATARQLAGCLPSESPLRIGLSTHSPEEARLAMQCKPDYIGFGPIWDTITKVRPDPVTGLAPLRQTLSNALCPVVAIGGIFPENLDEVLDAGARNVALVRYLMEHSNPDRAIVDLQKRLRRCGIL